MNAEEFYEKAVAKFKVHDAFSDWKAYRSRLTEYIISHSEGCRSIAILGVGSSNDIDLSRIYGGFEDITLFDIDKAAMKEALRKYGLDGKPGVSCVEADFFGLDKKDYVNFIKASKPGEELEKMYEKVHKHCFNLGERRYDVCVAVGLHSQLNAMPDYLVNVLDLEGKRELTERIVSENEYVAKKMNDAIFDSALWKAFIGTELLEERNGGSNQVQGALQAAQDIVNRNTCGELRIEKVIPLEWPFSAHEHRKYTMGLIDISCI